MDIKDFKKRKRAMELEIGEAVNKAILSFQKETDYIPHDVKVTLNTGQTLGGMQVISPPSVRTEVTL